MRRRLLGSAAAGLLLTAGTVLYSFTARRAVTAPEIRFLLHPIGNDRSEGVAVFDMDGDGILDVTSGAYWYKGPDWEKQAYREANVFGEFVGNCGEFAADVNQDGAMDMLSASWQEDGLFYYENPRQPGQHWPRRKITGSRDTEGLLHVDIDGDGIADLLPSHYSEQPVFWVKVGKEGFARRPVSGQGNGHGVGFGDVDGDGKPDILTANGWHRQIDLEADQWEYHPDWQVGLAGIGMYVYDFNQDGLPDVLYGRGHDYGLYWLEQRVEDGRRTWTEHLIDGSYSQIHNVKMVDLDGDGVPEVLAGKRYRGHNEQDPGSFDPLAIYYYTIQPGPEPRFERHTIAYNAIAGAGTQWVVVDLDGDGDLDLVCAGKTGQYWFENMTVNQVPWQERKLLMEQYPVTK